MKCKNCGKEFLKQSYSQLHCSSDCRKQYQQRTENRTWQKGTVDLCKHCGRSYRKQHHRRLYCSDRCCKDAYNERRKTRTTAYAEGTQEQRRCKHCLRSYRPNSDKQKYCSRKCCNESRNEIRRNRKQAYTKICPGCNKAFETRLPQKVWCKSQCRQDAAQPTPRPCKHCGRVFSPSHGLKTYCSDSCYSEQENARNRRRYRTDDDYRVAIQERYARRYSLNREQEKERSRLYKATHPEVVARHRARTKQSANAIRIADMEAAILGETSEYRPNQKDLQQHRRPIHKDL